MDKFNLEYQYQLYLERIGQVESEMHTEQKRQVKMAFIGAIGQFLVLLEFDVADLSEDEAVEKLESMKTQVANYYLSITTNQN